MTNNTDEANKKVVPIVCMPMSMTILRMFLAFPPKNKELNPGAIFFLKFIAVSILGCLPLLSSIMHLIKTVQDKENNRIELDLTYAVSFSTAYALIWAFIIKIKSAAEMYTSISDFDAFGKPTDFDQDNKDFNKYAKMHFVYLESLIWVIIVTSNLFKTESCRMENQINNMTEVCGLFSYTWMPFNIDYSPVREIYALVQIFGEDYFEEMSLNEFLRSRKISEEIILRLEDENIDSTSIVVMSEDELSRYFPKHGDRVIVLNYCRKVSKSKKLSLIEKLKSKLDDKAKLKKGRDGSLSNKSYKQKETRMIEVGWFCSSKQNEKLRQVRISAGGGKRRIAMKKSSKCFEVLERAKELFFPQGKSTKGSIDLFDIELLDYKNHVFDMDLTIQNMYEITSLATLRFYLSTTKKDCSKSSSDDDSDYIPETATSSEIGSNSVRSRTTESQNNYDLSKYLTDFDENETNQEVASAQNVLLGEVQHEFQSLSENSTFTNEPDYLQNNSYIELPDINIPLDLPINIVNQESTEKICLVIHRGHIYDEVLKAFEQHDLRNFKIAIEMILPTGEPEKAEDIGGVFRDVLSEFWDHFYERCTVGTGYKVPSIRHDYGEQQWKAIADIFVKGFQEENYFPIKLAPSFMKTIFNIHVDEKELLNNFLSYLPESEADVLKRAFDNFGEVDFEELLDILDGLDCKWKPSDSNIKQLLQDIAHKELIQKPSFITQCFKQRIYDITYIDLDNLYTQCEPTVKNIISKLQLSDTCDESDQKVFNFFKKYIRECDRKTRENLLRFCTGSNIVGPAIQIIFNNLSGAQRRPIAHTCTSNLELSRFYDSYLDFRNDFNEIFKSNIWVMDIV